MLSSRDYSLIKDWMERGLSKEQIFNGIRTAFEQKAGDRIRNIYDCKEHVESSELKTNRSESLKEDFVELKRYIDQIVNNFNKLISYEKHPNLLKLHNKYKSEISNLDAAENSVFVEINKIEEEYFKDFLEYLDKKDMKRIKQKIDKAVNAGNDYINEESKKKALNIQLKNLIIEDYISFNPFKTDQ